MPLFGKKYSTIRVKKREIPEGLWTKCRSCGQLIYTKVVKENLNTCPKCNFHMTIKAQERIRQLADDDSFTEIDSVLVSRDPLKFQGAKSYEDKLNEDKKRTGLIAAAITGEASIDGYKLVLGVTDSRFIMGSMGSVVGEKITRAAERAIEKKIPLVIVSGSGGGARMYEGCLSLMQMAKTSSAIARLQKEGLLFISILSNPTMAGVLASFATLGDVLIAEPGALIGFTGPRVIKQTIKQELPKGFQRPVFLLEHGLIDMIVHRKNMRPTIVYLLETLAYNRNNN